MMCFPAPVSLNTESIASSATDQLLLPPHPVLSGQGGLFLTTEPSERLTYMTNSNSRGSGGSGAGFSFMRRIWIILFAIAETLLAARVVLKATGAEASNALVKGIYDVTGEVTRVFEGIIAPSASFPMEPAALLAMAAIALVFWFVLKVFNWRT